MRCQGAKLGEGSRGVENMAGLRVGRETESYVLDRMIHVGGNSVAENRK